MNIEFTFEWPHTQWSVLHVFKEYYESFIKKNKRINTTYVSSSNFYDGNPAGPFSAQSMIIKNIDTKKYIVVTYWDRPEELRHDGNGWDNKNCVSIITSAGYNSVGDIYKPFTYLPYTLTYESLINTAKKFSFKKNNELSFRGYLYGQRYYLAELNLINITDKKTFPETNYFEELTNNKICLSLNGAGQICNRDVEILGSRSVLFREKLTSNFYNELRPDYHYLTYEHNDDPKIQSEIILNRFDEIKNNKKLLRFIGENGYKWYKNNCTIQSNVKILNKIININQLK